MSIEYEIYLGDCLDIIRDIPNLNTNRKFIGIEKEKKYFNIAKERLERYRGGFGYEIR